LIVGNFHIANGRDHAFRYSRGTGVESLGAIGGTAAFATGISKSGVVVGIFFGDSSFLENKFYNHVFLFTKSDGVRQLGAMGGKSAGTVRISSDGKKLAGSYRTSTDESYAYVAAIR
jgi:uncharacterized membrane protein